MKSSKLQFIERQAEGSREAPTARTADIQLGALCLEKRRAYQAAYWADHRAEKSAYDAAYYQAHRAEKSAYRKVHRAMHPGECKAYRAAYYVAHRQEQLAGCAAHYATHRKEKAAYGSAYRKAHPEVGREHARKHDALKRQTRQIAPGHVLTRVGWENIVRLAKGRCYWCKRKRKLTQDHVIPLSKGGLHVAENVVASCRSCNSSKGAKVVTLF